MPLQVGDLYYNVMKRHSFCMRVETDAAALNNFVLRIANAEKKEWADATKKYDLAFVSGQYGDALILAEKVLERGVSAIVLNGTTCSKKTRRDVVTVCVKHGAALISVIEYGDFANVLALFTKQWEYFESQRAKLHFELQNVLIYHEKPDQVLSMMQGYQENVTCCAAVLRFVSRCRDVSITGFLSWAERLAEVAVNQAAPDSHAVCVGRQIALIFSGKAESTILRAAERAVEALCVELGDQFDIFIGIGKPCQGMDGIYESFMTASRTAGIQVIRKTPCRSLCYEALGVSKLLMEIDPSNESLEKYYREMIYPLVEFDKRNSTNLLEFLMTYFKYGCCKKDLGEELFMHRNSVNYKLRKISGIVGKDLSNITELLEVFVAVKLYELSYGEDT